MTTTATTDKLESLVHRGVRRARNILTGISIAGLALGVAMIAAGAWAADDTFGPDHVHRWRVASVVTGAILGALSVYLLGSAIRIWNPNRSPVARLVVDHPENIRWIYVEEIASKAYGITVKRTRNIKIGDAAGKLHALMTRGTEVDAALEMLTARAPHARVGYDADARAAFKQVKALRRRAA